MKKLRHASPRNGESMDLVNDTVVIGVANFMGFQIKDLSVKAKILNHIEIRK
jgi:hypothetical protein